MPLSTDHLRLGIFVCPTGAENDQCTLDGKLPNITASVSIYSRTSTIVASRSNSSIVSLTELSQPIRVSRPNVLEYRQAIDWLLDFQSAGIPSPSSIAAVFWNGQQQLSNAYWASELAVAFRSIVAFPLWMFQPNNFGNIALAAQEITSDLPPEMYTTASIATPQTRIVIDNAVYTVFVIFQSTVLVFVLGVLLWLILSGNSGDIQISSYPLLDLWLKISKPAFVQPSQNILQADDAELLELLLTSGPVMAAGSTTPSLDTANATHTAAVPLQTLAPDNPAASIANMSSPALTHNNGSQHTLDPPASNTIDLAASDIQEPPVTDGTTVGGAEATAAAVNVGQAIS